MPIGPHKFEFEVIQGWQQMPEGWFFVEVAGVAVDSKDRVYVFNRGEHPMMVFDKEGKFLNAWGEGVFSVPHGIAVDKSNRVYVCDRENSRIQILTADGAYIDSWYWVNRPTDIFIDDQEFIYIAELGWTVPARTTRLHYNTMQCPPCGHDPIARCTVCTPDGQIVARIGGNNPVLPGNFMAPHGLWCDSEGALYMGEVIVRSGGNDHFAPLTGHTLQKFKRSL